MNILVFSDIHGSLPAAKRMTSLAARHRPDAILLLGDILYHGPRNPLPQGYDPKAAAEELAPLKSRIIAVSGNCDSPVDSMVLPFPVASDFAWIVSDGIRLYATHGHTFGPHNLPPLEEGDVLVSGHTHVPMVHTTSAGIHLCNPGSLSLPKEGHPASYGIFNMGVFSVYTTEDELYLQLTCV